MGRRITAIITTVACALPLAGAAAGTAGAAERYVALGDSFTAAPLVPDIVGTPTSCLRSSHNYPSVLARALRVASFADASCSGAVTADMTRPQRPTLLGPDRDLVALAFGENPPQLDRLRPDTTLVTVGIGGNDAGLVDVGYRCAAAGLLQATGSPCRDALTAGGVDQVGRRIDDAAPDVAAVLRGIRSRAPRARILVVGYPQIVPDDGRSCWPLPLPLSDGDVPFMAALLVRINAMLAREARAAGAEYVDTWERTRGYDVCQPLGRSGFTALLPLSGQSMPLHPNELGQHRVAEAIVHVVRRGAPARPDRRAAGRATGPGRDLDRSTRARSGTGVDVD
ncbi:MAG: SGNH/GDSL hydrolase family protein [Solirubrobacteraceae bacterium]|nr:SGNH/GDSL hydrolase family protein [Solirubrobacteraceae bacterium]